MTYVVDKGSLYDVAKEINIPATTKLTDALITSNAGLSLVSILLVNISGTSNLFSIVFLTEEGRIFENKVDIEDPTITINLDKKFGLNLSETSP